MVAAPRILEALSVVHYAWPAPLPGGSRCQWQLCR